MDRKIILTSCIIIACCFISSLSIGQPQREHGLGDIPLSKETYEANIRYEANYIGPPKKYDARNYGLVTPAKDQGSCGSCWAFASAGAMESHLLKLYKVGPKDIAEQQQLSCNRAFDCLGGSSTAIKYWEIKGPVDETYLPYTGKTQTTCKEEENAQIKYYVTEWHTVPKDSHTFKQSLYDYGPSYWRFDVYSDFDSKDNQNSYWKKGKPGEVYVHNSGTFQGGHAVLLIGWDDEKGAYLCKNSWGLRGGPNGDGTFWISYDGHSKDLNFGMVNFKLTTKKP